MTIIYRDVLSCCSIVGVINKSHCVVSLVKWKMKAITGSGSPVSSRLCSSVMTLQRSVLSHLPACLTDY